MSSPISASILPSLRLASVLACMAVAAMAHAQTTQPVVSPGSQVDTYFGTEVADPYRGMEKLADPQVQAWMKSQAAYTRAKLDAIPGRQALLERIHALSSSDLSRGGFVRRGQRYFYQTREPGAQLPKLFYRDGVAGEEHLLLDPGALGAGTSTHYALDYFEPSWDGRYVAYGISSGGSEASVMHVLDLKTGKAEAEAIVRASDSVIAWRPDNRSFFYLRYLKPTPETPPSQTEFNARTYLHTVGTRPDGDGDPVVFGRGVSPKLDVPEAQGTYVLLWPGSPWAVAVVNRNMDDNPATLYVAPLSQVNGSATPWKKIADVEDGVTKYEVRGDTLYFLAQKGAPRFHLMAMSLAHPDIAKARVIVPEGPGVLTNFTFDRDSIYLRRTEGPVSKVTRVSMDGKQVHEVPLPFEGNAGPPVADPREPGVLIREQGWLQSAHEFAYDPAKDAVTDTGLVPPSKLDTSAYESKEVFAISHDGTRIPLSLVYKKGLQLDGSHPTLMEGYGSYGLSLEPYFSSTRLAWIERGGIFAVAHVRGGGEYGESWHLAGQRLFKPNTWLDFIACGQYLVDQRYTSSAKLAGEGGSAGGITIGRTLTTRPDLFGVILDDVGMSDTLRAETEPNGPPNVPEFGSTKDEAGFHGLYAMSSYDHVRDGTPYPAVMFTTGANDPRVAPWHMTKMAARVQAATSSGKPVLLRIDYDAGHGIGSSMSQYESELADQWSFALWQMGEPGFQP